MVNWYHHPSILGPNHTADVVSTVPSTGAVDLGKAMVCAHGEWTTILSDFRRDRHYGGIWYRRVGKWLHYMEKTYQEWLHEVDLSYHILGLRHTLIQKGLQRREEAPHNTACSPPQAKRTCTTRRITGRTRASPDSPTHIAGAKKTCHK